MTFEDKLKKELKDVEAKMLSVAEQYQATRSVSNQRLLSSGLDDLMDKRKRLQEELAHTEHDKLKAAYNPNSYSGKNFVLEQSYTLTS